MNWTLFGLVGLSFGTNLLIIHKRGKASALNPETSFYIMKVFAFEQSLRSN